MSAKTRMAIGGLALSAAAFVGLITKEGYTDQAIIPVKGDVPTVGFGMTLRPDGSPVQLGDRTTPVIAAQRTLEYIKWADDKLRACIFVPLHQEEYDLLHDHAYQYGVATTCASSMVSRANARDYAGSCASYLAYKKVDGFDCSTPGNKRCPGVWTRSKERYTKCMAVQ